MDERVEHGIHTNRKFGNPLGGTGPGGDRESTRGSGSNGIVVGEGRDTPANAPPDATAQCNDGTFSKAKEHRGACSGHKGVKAWFK